jgi:GNAT superfamily N-acetyltransferase
MPLRLPFLPGRFVIERGSIADYHALARFHYRPGKPATVAGVWRVRYLHGERSKRSELAAVGVLSWPVPCVRERNLAFGLLGLRYGQKIRFANAHLRTISRVIVHPVFRSTGLATRLVRRMIADCPTPHVEALATMGWVHPFFDRAGMTRVDPEDSTRPVYYYASHPNLNGGADKNLRPTQKCAIARRKTSSSASSDAIRHPSASFRTPSHHPVATLPAP